MRTFPPVRASAGERGLASGQGALYVATGVWPLLHMPSFEAVTGPRLERWLVQTVGVLVASIGADAAVELALAGAWLAFARRSARGGGER